MVNDESEAHRTRQSSEGVGEPEVTATSASILGSVILSGVQETSPEDQRRASSKSWFAPTHESYGQIPVFRPSPDEDPEGDHPTTPDRSEGTQSEASMLSMRPVVTPVPGPVPSQTRTIALWQTGSLIVLAVIALLGAIYAARAILFPIALAVLIALTLRPLVRWMEKRHIPPTVGAGGTIMLLVGFLIFAAMSLVEPARGWIGEAPARMKVVGEKLSSVRHRLDRFYEVGDRLDALANGEPAEPETKPNLWDRVSNAVSGENEALAQKPLKESKEPIEVQISQPRLVSNLLILNSAGSVIAATAIVLVLAFFLLAYGDVLINNTLHCIPTLSHKKNLVRLVQNVERGISDYLFTVTLINVMLGMVISLVMWTLGVPNPILWGLMATVLNFVPYVGALAGAGVMFAVAVFTFDSILFALIPPFAYLTVTTIEGQLITPRLVGRSAALNVVGVFTALVFWGWMWGLGGALIGIPLLIVFRIICAQFEQTRPIAILLGE